MHHSHSAQNPAEILFGFPSLKKHHWKIQQLSVLSEAFRLTNDIAEDARNLFFSTVSVKRDDLKYADDNFESRHQAHAQKRYSWMTKVPTLTHN